MLYPIKIERVGDKLRFSWNDGHEDIFSLSFLRKVCPCATCSAERESGRDAELPSSAYDIKEVNLVGNYAIQITWGDGHNTGIYSFDYLRLLKEE